jgi:hypothetical protein
VVDESVQVLSKEISDCGSLCLETFEGAATLEVSTPPCLVIFAVSPISSSVSLRLNVELISPPFPPVSVSAISQYILILTDTDRY